MAKSTRNSTTKRVTETAETAPAAAKTAAATAPSAKPAKVARKPVPRSLARPPFRHPNLGLAPLNMRAGFPEAAERLRRETAPIAGRALEAAVEKDPTIKARYDEVGLRHLLRDAELLVERLAMCLGSGNPRWLVEYAEWIAPIYRRRGVSLLDMCALSDGVRGATAGDLGPGERAVAARSLDAATTVWKRNSRLAGDSHKRNALWKWMYRGI